MPPATAAAGRIFQRRASGWSESAPAQSRQKRLGTYRQWSWPSQTLPRSARLVPPAHHHRPVAVVPGMHHVHQSASSANEFNGLVELTLGGIVDGFDHPGSVPGKLLVRIHDLNRKESIELSFEPPLPGEICRQLVGAIFLVFKINYSNLPTLSAVGTPCRFWQTQEQSNSVIPSALPATRPLHAEKEKACRWHIRPRNPPPVNPIRICFLTSRSGRETENDR